MGDFNDGGRGGDGGGGQSLGGAGGAPGGPLRLSPEEIRQRRLQTLERISVTNRSPTPPITPRTIPLEDITAPMMTTTTTTSISSSPPPFISTTKTNTTTAAAATATSVPPTTHPSTPPPRRVVTYSDDFSRDDQDAELQAALALSMAEATRQQEEKESPNDKMRMGDSSGNPVVVVGEQDDMDETDHELQAALSLSLQQGTEHDIESSTFPSDGGTTTTTTTSSDTVSSNSIGSGEREPTVTNSNSSSTSNHHNATTAATPTTTTQPVAMTNTVNLEGLSPAVAECYKTSEPCRILDFHSVMWDSGVTTDNDKQRWLSQGINFRDYDPEGKLKGERAKESVLADVISNHGPWGLTQAHGGPCGVLAAVQAELLRLLLFGSRDPLNYPAALNNVQARKMKSDLDEPLMLEGLAMSLALILARAAITPPATLDESKSTNNDSSDNKKNSEEGDASSHNNDESPVDASSTNTVQIVLPIYPHDLAWEDFEPWYGNPASDIESFTLRTYSITTPSADPSSFKRQKTNGSPEQPPPPGTTQQIPSSSSPSPVESVEALDERIIRLAHAVKQFLLEKPRGVDAEAPLLAFRKPGGVILFVMSLAFSRGTRLVQSEMDDPMARLTSQFGHCGQELLNLLLTGQSVSNVFDNTLTPSGDLVCRGIQGRSSVGYLTQLEAMRYLEVGGYYKTPRYPIWVVGSTSHFTVMFGDAVCLRESRSDVLLEKCRRAFKAIDGGGENGFIPTQALGGFLKSLDLDIPDHGVQTLAATIEMHGAGIILWDALWKHTSRLMTGATLESVLQFSDPQHQPSTDLTGPTNDEDPLPLLLTQFGEAEEELDRKPSASNGTGVLNSVVETGESSALTSSSLSDAPASAVAAAASASPMDLETSPPLSDEELARKLQEEWNAELTGIGVSTDNSLAAVRGSPTPSNWSNTADDMNISGFTLSPNPALAADGTNTNDPPASGNATSTSATTSSTFSNLSSSNASSTEHNHLNTVNGPTLNTDTTAAATIISSMSSITNPQPPGSGHTMEYEKFGRTFQLYHYNGLRGGTLRAFRVTRLSPEEAVGASISLMGNNPSSAAHGGNGDLEDVIRTKWPSCMINFLGNPPPSID